MARGLRGDAGMDQANVAGLAFDTVTEDERRMAGGARIAVQFVVNCEEGAENCVLHGDAESEAFLSEIVGAVTP